MSLFDYLHYFNYYLRHYNLIKPITPITRGKGHNKQPHKNNYKQKIKRKYSKIK